MFEIEKLRIFMQDNSTNRRVFGYSLGLMILSEDYVYAFEHWYKTGESILPQWDAFHDLINYTEKAISPSCLIVSSDIQFISENDIKLFFKLINNETPWDAAVLLRSTKVSLDDCKTFLNELQKIKEKGNLHDFLKPVTKNKEPIKKRGYIYFLKCEDNLCKIGKTRNLSTRIKQYSYLPIKLTLFHQLYTIDMQTVEDHFLNLFSSKAVRGKEWLKLNEDDIEMIVNENFPNYIKELLEPEPKQQGIER